MGGGEDMERRVRELLVKVVVIQMRRSPHSNRHNELVYLQGKTTEIAAERNHRTVKAENQGALAELRPPLVGHTQYECRGLWTYQEVVAKVELCRSIQTVNSRVKLRPPPVGHSQAERGFWTDLEVVELN